MCCCCSGGLITGIGPFVERFHEEGFLDGHRDLSAVINGGFQIMAFGAAISSIAIDCIGPRKVASLGLLILCVGEFVIGNSSPRDATLLQLICGYGCIGAGGYAFYATSFVFCRLFQRHSHASAILASSFNLSGMLFMFLNIRALSIAVFFNGLAVLAICFLGAALILYPSKTYDTDEAKAPSFGIVKQHIMRRQYWLFSMSFAWAALANILIAGVLNDVVFKLVKSQVDHREYIRIF